MTTPLVRIVDDDADARSSSSFFLSMMGLEIKEYDSAYRFLEEDDMNRPGCIILDVRMPDMTGMELQVKTESKGLPPSDYISFRTRRIRHGRPRLKTRRF